MFCKWKEKQTRPEVFWKKVFKKTLQNLQLKEHLCQDLLFYFLKLS